MELVKPLANLVNYANAVGQSNSRRLFRLAGTLITPVGEVPVYFIGGFARKCSFGIDRSDDCEVTFQIQPGVYQNDVLPYKEDLYFEMTERTELSQIVRRFRAVPLSDSNPSMMGNNSSLADLSTKDENNLVQISVQLLDPGYSLMRNTPVADHMMMTPLDQTLHYQLDKVGEGLKLTGIDKYRGVDIEYPIDNDRIFKQIIIPPMAIKDLPMFLQLDDKFGIYSRGMAAYYRKGMWYVYPPLKITAYSNARQVVNIYALPEDVLPTLDNTWFWEDKVLTILSTGQGDMVDGSDIQKQNHGSGKRVINAEVTTGQVGRYYNKGVALSTREDSLSEFKTSDRLSGEDNIVFQPTPTSNLCKLMTQNAYTDGNFVTRTWHNSDVLQITPGMPCRYYYMEGEQMKYFEGRITSVRGEYQRHTKEMNAVFQEHAAIDMFLGKTSFSV